MEKDPCIIGDKNIKNMYSAFKTKNPNIPMSTWANRDEYICNNEKYTKIKNTFIPCDTLKGKAFTCINHLMSLQSIERAKEQIERNIMAQQDEMTIEKKKEAEKRKEEAEKRKEEEERAKQEEERAKQEEEGASIQETLRKEDVTRKEIESKNKVKDELTLINAWDAISTNNKLDNNKITPDSLKRIASALKNPKIQTFDNVRKVYIIPDGQFDKLIQNIKTNLIMNQVGLTQDDINRHKNERSDFKAKMNPYTTSASMSKSWKQYKPWGGKKTRKGQVRRRKTKKGRNKKRKTNKRQTK